MAVKAVEFPVKLKWLNTPEPLSLETLRGHAVLLCFWNCFTPECLRAAAEVAELADRFKTRPLAIIGVHSSRFGEAIGPESVASSALRLGMQYPLVMDVNLEVWNAYGISAWPSFIIIDADSNVRGAVTGEGKMAALERALKAALDEGEKAGLLADKPARFHKIPGPPSLLAFPGKLEIDRKRGHIFISDTGHHRILQCALEGDSSAKLIMGYGSGRAGFSDGRSSGASFNSPMGLSLSGGTLYVADMENHAVRSVDMKTGAVTTLAGNGRPGFSASYNGTPLKIALNAPMDIVSDGANLYIAMAGLHQVWQLDIENNYISNFIGAGIESMIDGPFGNSGLAKPCGLSLRGNRLFIAEGNSSALRCADLSTHRLTTLIGIGIFDFGYVDGHFSDARMLHCQGIEAVGEKIFIADTYNNAVRYADLMGTVIYTLVSRKTESTFRTVPGPEGPLPLFEPGDVAYYNGKVYIADSGNHLIRVLDLGRQTLSVLDIT